MKLSIIVLTACVLLFGCVGVVMNRKFAGDEHLVEVGKTWRVGAPKAVALRSSSDKSYWESQDFTVYIPITTHRERNWIEDFDTVTVAIVNELIKIEEIEILLHKAGDTIRYKSAILPIDARPIRGLVPGKPAFEYPQGLFENDYLCIYTTDVIVPATEDTISVNFAVGFRNTTEDEFTLKNLTFTMWRQEGKKLFVNWGR